MEKFVGQEVTLKKYNCVGVVETISEEDGFITIVVKDEEKSFAPTTIINGTIKFVNEETQKAAVSFFTELIEKIEKMEDIQILEAENQRISNKRREIGCSNVAFKCTFCNGGASNDCVGFKGPCSAEVREYNVAHRKWCGGPSCRCAKLVKGEMTTEQFNEKLNSTNRLDFLCYEYKMLVNWVCFAGMEEKTGEPMSLANIQLGSLAVMTTRPVIGKEEVPEEQRQIFGVFLIAKHDEKSDIGGSATAHPIYRLELTPEESRQILFWKYYYNEGNSNLISWTYHLHRYLSDMQCCQILRDIVKVIKKDEKKKALAIELLNKFKEETGIDEIANPKGPIH